MSIKHTITTVIGVTALLVAGCSSGGSQQPADSGSASDTGSAASGQVVKLKVAASPTPHAKILDFVNRELAAKEGLELEVVVFQDYIQPNEALRSGEVDANYFQTVPFLEEQSKQQGYKFEAGKGVHLEPLGVYSEKVKDVSEIKEGATIGIINDPTNQARALKLLSENKLINLPEGKSVTVSEVKNSPEINPLKLDFKEVEGPQLVRVLADVDAAVINGNLALGGGKKPADAIALESTENNPAANLLVWDPKSDKLDAIKKLEKLLHSDEVRSFIEKTWSDKSVIPVF